MSDTKGPKVDLPVELMAELEGTGDAKPDAAADAAAAATAELVELKDRYLRLAAEFDNFRRRNLKERQDLHNYANEGLVKDLLPVVDNLERAVVHGRKEEQRADSEKLLQGVELTVRSLVQILERFGVVEIEAEGKPFDPQVHEAVNRVSTGEHAPGTVVAVYQKGYLLKDRLLRPAMVAVAGEPE